MQCFGCDCTDFVETVEHQQFPWLNKGQIVILTADVPVMTCKRCGAQFTDYRGEEARDLAVLKARNDAIEMFVKEND